MITENHILNIVGRQFVKLYVCDNMVPKELSATLDK